MIIDTIRDAQMRFNTENAKDANVVYLGQAEVDALDADLGYHETIAYKIAHGDTEPTVLGMRIVLVEEASHLTVGTLE